MKKDKNNVYNKYIEWNGDFVIKLKCEVILNGDFVIKLKYDVILNEIFCLKCEIKFIFKFDYW